MPLIRIILLTAFCLQLATAVFSQAVVSPALLAHEGRLEPNKTLLSISVRQASAFKHAYDGLVILEKLAAANCFLVTMPARAVFEQMKSDSNIIFIDLLLREAKPEAALDFINPAFNRITKARTAFPLVRGTPRNISIKELSFDPTQIDIVNRTFTTAVTPSAQEQHATNMAILLGGGGNSSYRAQGVAPQARLTSSDFQNLFPDDAALFNNNNIYVQNHSYGVGIENYYGNEAFAYDQQVTQQPSMVHIFSAGNRGTTAPTSGSYSNLLYANLTGNFKQAKNVLVVTAVDSTLGVNSFNSRGPAYDGRLKPELTAYGQGGTSDAAAIISGIATLLQEKYEAMQAALPDASLVKAILIATAEDIGTVGIDFTYGYGSVNAYKALQLLELGQWAYANLTSNDVVSIPITVPTGVAEIKIAVSWTDPAALPNSSTALVNDIDSQLEFGGDTFLPWVLNAYPHVDSLAVAPKRKADHINTIEYITLNNPTPGTYSLKLSSGTLSTTSQSVSVAYWMSPDDLFSWDFPQSNDVVEGGASNLLVWEAQPGQTGDLYAQLNQGDWMLVAPSQPLDDYLYWEAPDTLARARLKMQIGTDEILSEEFLISPLIKLNTAFICADSLGVSWNPVPAATGYRIYTMGTQYLTEASVTTETVKVFSPSANLYFAVSPLLAGAEGLKSETINYTLQGASCFLNSFSALRLTSTELHIQLRLSSTYQISNVKIFKTVNGITEVLTEFTPQNQTLFDYDDAKLFAGTMEYQAEITFNNGKTLRSDVIYVPIEKVNGVILYPNPVTDESDLNILSAGDGRIFIIFDGSGRKLYEGDLQAIESSVDIINLPAGIYFYKLLSAGKVTDAGRFIKY